jgi:hypothetical protein
MGGMCAILQALYDVDPEGRLTGPCAPSIDFKCGEWHFHLPPLLETYEDLLGVHAACYTLARHASQVRIVALAAGLGNTADLMVLVNEAMHATARYVRTVVSDPSQAAWTEARRHEISGLLRQVMMHAREVHFFHDND